LYLRQIGRLDEATEMLNTDDNYCEICGDENIKALPAFRLHPAQ